MKRRIRPFPLALLLVILALVGCFIGFTLKTQQVNANFHYNAAYEDLNLNRPKAVFQRLSEDGYDLSMPGLSGPVTFTSPCNFSFFQDFKEHDVKKGDTLPGLRKISAAGQGQAGRNAGLPGSGMRLPAKP